jgi:hypothetical protein
MVQMTTDIFSEVRNVHGLSCAAAGPTTMVDGLMVLNCPETVVPNAFSMSSDGALDVTAESRFTRPVTIETDAPSLTMSTTDPAIARQFLRISDSALVLSDLDTSRETRIDSRVIVAGGMDVAKLTAETLALRIATNDEDVTANPLVRMVTVTVAGDGGVVTIPAPECGAGWDRVREIVGVLPPAPITQDGVEFDRIMSVASGNWSTDSPVVNVTYGRAVIRPTTVPDTCGVIPGSIQEETEDLDGLAGDRFLYSLKGQVRCLYDANSIGFDTVTVTNPDGTRFSAMVGCNPQ